MEKSTIKKPTDLEYIARLELLDFPLRILRISGR